MPNEEGGGGIIGFDYTYSAAETFYFAETISFASSKPISEIVALGEDFSKLGSFVRLHEEDAYLDEDFSYEHFAEKINTFERPYITRVRSVPVMTLVSSVTPIIRAVRGFEEEGG